MLVDLIFAEAKMYNQLEVVGLHWQQGLKALHYIGDYEAVLEASKYGLE